MANSFLGGSEMGIRAEMIGMNNKLVQAELAAQKTASKEITASGKIKQTDKKYLDEVRKTAIEFESVFLGYMLKQMKKTVPADPLFGESVAKDIFQDMQYDNMAKEMAKAGGIGLATILYNQLSKVNNGEGK